MLRESGSGNSSDPEANGATEEEGEEDDYYDDDNVTSRIPSLIIENIMR